MTSTALATSSGRLRRPMSLRNSIFAAADTVGAPCMATHILPKSTVEAFITAASIHLSPPALPSAFANASFLESLSGKREAVSAS